MTDKTQTFDVAIIGAGPAGMMAAIQAAINGKKVLLLEKNDMPGKKLLISGKGRCNLTNAEQDIGKFLNQFSGGGKFLRNCFHVFFNTEIISFLESEGLYIKTERGGRVFPDTDSSRDVLNVFIKKIKALKICFFLNAEVRTVTKENSRFRVSTNKWGSFSSEKLIIATGGVSYPATGSTGFGLKLASVLGHTVTPVKPALTGINLKEKLVLGWKGISLKNVRCSLFQCSKKISSQFGEMLFTHFGVSGPIILDLSADCFDLLQSRKDVHISIDFKPALSYDTLKQRIMHEFESAKNKTVVTVIRNLLPKKMAEGFLKMLNIKHDKSVHQITKKERSDIILTLKSMDLKVSSTRPIAEAIVTRGGISTKEIDPRTMESKILKGLFFAGEVIDIDAKTGGYNMQAAFSTGYAAGVNI